MIKKKFHQKSPKAIKHFQQSSKRDNSHKPRALLYKNYKWTEGEIRETTPFTIASSNTKYLGGNSDQASETYLIKILSFVIHCSFQFSGFLFLVPSLGLFSLFVQSWYVGFWFILLYCISYHYHSIETQLLFNEREGGVGAHRGKGWEHHNQEILCEKRTYFQ